MEGEIKFLIKGLESKASLPDSAFLRALRIFNLNAIVEGINSDSLLGSRNLMINRAEGDFYVCLLYTSPSPRDLWISRMPSSA